jgi:hypothetical protein
MNNLEAEGLRGAGAAPKAQARSRALANSHSIRDGVSCGLLLAWTALALIGLTFGSTVGQTVVDAAAWFAFGVAMLLSVLPRWLSGVSDKEVIGPYRLWAAACTAALLFCMASSFLVAPRIKGIQTQIDTQALSAEIQDALSKSHARAKSLSVQFRCIRMVLAVGLALGARKLPRALGGYKKEKEQ